VQLHSMTTVIDMADCRVNKCRVCLCVEDDDDENKVPHLVDSNSCFAVVTQIMLLASDMLKGDICLSLARTFIKLGMH
jgi:hypothetical protein